MNPLDEDKVIEIMKERGYTLVSTQQKSDGTNRRLNFLKVAEKKFESIHASVFIEQGNMELTFGNLNFFFYLSSVKFDFFHKDFLKFENSLLMYVALCVGEHATEIMEYIKAKKAKDDSDSQQPSITLDRPKKEKSIKERKREFWDEIVAVGKKKAYAKDMCLAFYNYWSEVSDSGKSLRFEIQKRKGGTFDVKGRLVTWANKEKDYKSSYKNVIDKKIEKQNQEIKTSKTIDKNELF